jgi:hypothetical protein
MKGDFSKGTFDAAKHFHDVLMQQGRVSLDQEWNEQADIHAHRTETGTKDILGSSGAPLHNAGFAITPVMGGGSPPTANNLQIGKGNYYVDGILCENENDFLFAEQPDFETTPLPAEPGTYIFYLDVWLRHITALEDTSIREVALGGPDTTTRNKTIWQVKYISTAADALCSAGIPQAITAPSNGTMNARSEVTTASDDPCGLTSSGGYRRLQNQLYRVEIHIAGADRAHATFKWSRDNGSVLVKCTGQEAVNKNNFLVTSTGRDDLLGFKSGNWVEVIHDDNDLLNTPGILAQILTVNRNVLTIDPATIKDPQNPAATFITIDTAKNPRIRRWDSGGDIDLNTNNNTWLALEDGVEVNFREGTFKTGDYWLVPARTAIADVEWPFTTPQLAKGIQHHFAQLAIATLDAGGWTVTDCRSLFPPLTEFTSLYYVGGDGQQAMPGNLLPDSLKVGVANGEWIVSGAPIKFEILSGGGALTPASGIVTTGADGIASCQWELGTNTANLTLQVKASLLDDAGNILPNHLPIIFYAGFSIAEDVAYQPQCDNWTDGPPTTVAEALDQLCERRDGKHQCCSLTVGTGGDFETLELAIRELQGKEFICICLLPGEHKIGENSLGNLEPKMIKITGCGAEVLLFGISLKLQAEEIILEGLNIRSADFDLDTRIFLIAHKLHVEKCSFFGFAKEIYQAIPFVLVEALFTESIITEAEVNWSKNNVLLEKESGVALGFGQRIGGWIKDNNIGGDMMLQYDAKFADLDWQQFLNEQGQLPDKQVIESKLPSLLKLLPSPLVLHISGNIVRWVRTNANRIMGELPELLRGQTMREEQAAFNNLIVSDNVFQSGVGSFVAELLTMSNNHFRNNERNVLVAFTIGYRAIFTGNMDNIYTDNDTGGIIETMFNRKIISSNLIEIR